MSTTIKVYEFNPKNYKKTGALKKNATPEMSLTISDSLDGKDNSDYNAKYAAKQIKKAIPTFRATAPYIFSHIELSVPPLKKYIVYQTVRVAGTDLITSPTKLLAALKS
jgi:hypothetical protein